MFAGLAALLAFEARRAAVAKEDNKVGRHAAPDEAQPTSWVPNRKVVSSAVSGLVTLGLYYKFGPELDPELAGGLTLAVMTLVGYFVPLPE